MHPYGLKLTVLIPHISMICRSPKEAELYPWCFSIHPVIQQNTLYFNLLYFKACRTPSRDEAGIEMLISYFLQLGYVENRFFPPTRHMGILFTW